ncbi:MAG: hypothetical protein VB086_02780 [Clostridiaceae bacterium]|nr:hypothetical protein [Clostridiaceae bacterium]
MNFLPICGNIKIQKVRKQVVLPFAGCSIFAGTVPGVSKTKKAISQFRNTVITPVTNLRFEEVKGLTDLVIS